MKSRSTSFGFVSTYPPTQCGLATFTSALRKAIIGADAKGPVVRLVEQPQPRPSDEVVAQVVMADGPSLRHAAARLNECDLAIVQHEYGVYGGRDGDEVVTLLDQLEVPAIVVLHTVLAEPTVHQRAVLEAVGARADAVVVMTRAARDRLASGFDIDQRKVRIIPHGATEIPPATSTVTSRNDRFTVLTWGLIGPGKGIEWAIEAMALLGDLRPLPRYIIAGQTHPKVVLQQGEAYRDQLVGLVHRLGLNANVTFDGRYRDIDALGRLVGSADAVLLPYESTEQVTSGVLIEAVAAGKPVVATRFPHARELLAGGAGLVVPHRDPAAIAHALRSIITSRELAASMTAAASNAAPELRWSTVSEQYRALAGELIMARLAA
jgi:glycosyltransferase involved in cell wall biosynthesis